MLYWRPVLQVFFFFHWPPPPCHTLIQYIALCVVVRKLVHRQAKSSSRQAPPIYKTSPNASDKTFFHSPKKVSSIAHCSSPSFVPSPSTHHPFIPVVLLLLSMYHQQDKRIPFSLTFVLCFHNHLWHFTRRLIIIINQK